MTQYAQFDSTIASPSPVIGWYDTGVLTYPNLPSSSDLLELTSDEWNDRLTGFWAVSDGKLVSYTPPTPVLTLIQQAQKALYAGVTISLTGSITLAPTLFPCDPVTTGKLSTVLNILNATGSFPGGSSTYQMKDMENPVVWHTFTGPQYSAVVLAIGNYVAPLDLIIDGNPNVTTLPNSVIPTLTV